MSADLYIGAFCTIYKAISLTQAWDFPLQRIPSLLAQ